MGAILQYYFVKLIRDDTLPAGIESMLKLITHHINITRNK